MESKKSKNSFLETKRQLKEINKIVNICLASSKIKKLIIQEPKGEFSPRPTIHLFLRSQIGSGKSTVLEAISKEVNAKVLTEISQAGLIGTVDGTTKQVIPAKAWECRNNLMLLDEFKINRKDWGVFLQLLESQTWNKKFGMFSTATKQEDGDLYFNVENGNISLKTRFSCVIATMKRLEFQRGQDFRAFLSRCLIHQYHFGLQDLKFILRGNKIFTVDKALIDKAIKNETVTINKSNYAIIMNFVEKLFIAKQSKEQNKEELFMRCVGDCCRVFAVLGKHDKEFYTKIILDKFEAFEAIGAYYNNEKKNTA